MTPGFRTGDLRDTVRAGVLFLPLPGSFGSGREVPIPRGVSGGMRFFSTADPQYLYYLRPRKSVPSSVSVLCAPRTEVFRKVRF